MIKKLLNYFFFATNHYLDNIPPKLHPTMTTSYLSKSFGVGFLFLPKPAKPNLFPETKF
jgi:hypothetical protein